MKTRNLLPATQRLTSTAHPVPGNQEFSLAPSETIVELVKKIRSLTWDSLRVRTLGVMHGRSLVHLLRSHSCLCTLLSTFYFELLKYDAWELMRACMHSDESCGK
jgi:hypothetical protein